MLRSRAILNRIPFTLLVVVTLLIFGTLAWSSVLRYESYNAAMLDLGNIVQSIWSATQGEPLIYTSISGAQSRLAGPLELVFFILAPIYALFPNPPALLIFQAGLFASGAIPLFFLARRRLGNPYLALAVSSIYLLYPVAQTAVLFDIHGDTLAMPLLIFAIDALDREAWSAYAAWIILALMCKFYVAFAVLSLAVSLFLLKRIKPAIATATLGLFWLALTLFIHSQFGSGQVASSATSSLARYIEFYYDDPAAIVSSFIPRALSLAIAFGPALLLAIRSPHWLIPGLIMAAPIVLSTGPGPAYLYRFHHYALIVPFLMAALVFGASNFAISLSKRTRLGGTPWRSIEGEIILVLFLTLILNVALVQTPISPSFYTRYYPGTRDLPAQGITDRDQMITDWLDRKVPGEAPIASDILLAPHLTNRSTLYSTFYTDRDRALSGAALENAIGEVDFFVIDLFSAYFRQETLTGILQDKEFVLREARDGLLLFGRSAAGMDQVVSIMEPQQPIQLKTQFGEVVGLVDVQLAGLGEGKHRLTAKWTALSDAGNQSVPFAVSRIAGVENTRVVHIPTFILLPFSKWERGMIIEETVVFSVPEDLPPGEYALMLGWYELDRTTVLDAYESNRMGPEQIIATLEIP